ncbi:hypothetical protein VOLCADRAFT_89441 [Volvox carteri f. nagariensis]|uniref:Uncharacterized protein n=1 Tax=Volvox carteri f. nagariensis TaxID=3068 RepID=D8TRP7_VOLCA|nr:uncharacterized protein VOLCADRAFT_89441 [Volvox carteri f. nagariensis]EFJ49935.1 hypothetical protein VOLCADRAFT_89441 [Volvox carteri f. nagariensis]|eukprot:XP_002949000.1 hypothetical protein VOLCADRAFT_89441 [Volvox carteri f. nagariensis]
MRSNCTYMHKVYTYDGKRCDGFYPRGSKDFDESTPLSANGPLLKAIAIVGAESLKGGIARASGEYLGSPPDRYQGWGHLNLASSLPLWTKETNAENLQRIQVVNGAAIYDGETYYICGINATGAGPIRAALVWHDYPSNIMDAGIDAGSTYPNILVNDLDLYFNVNNGDMRNEREDHTNNVERFELETLEPGAQVTLKVNVSKFGTRQVPDIRVSRQRQLWSLVVVGHFKGNLRTYDNPSYKRPHRLQGLWRTSVYPEGLQINKHVWAFLVVSRSFIETVR